MGGREDHGSKTGERPSNGPEKQASGADPDASSAERSPPRVPIIGMGGSAGALGAFREFFEGMPSDSGAAFVLVQHLAPTHESLLTELLAQYTRMQVLEARDGTSVQANHVYVIPPDRYLGIRDGVLYLARPVLEHGIRLPIDYFLRALAEACRERAVCILFSGAGADGTLGVRAVRGAGGLTIAQDQTAQFTDMPRSAVATGLVDLVLPPDRMPQAIMQYLGRPYARKASMPTAEEEAAAPEGLEEILGVLRAETACDFRLYKRSTVLRRIERRMGLHHVSDMAEYGKLLLRDSEEVNQLHRDLLINVTAFFRDPEAFEALQLKALRPLVQARQTDEPVRVWAPGCSSGEEAYSVAILLEEEVRAARKHCPIQVFATDIDEAALQQGRTGIYSASIAADVTPERLATFFVRREHGFQVNETLRDAVVFATQNLITDPPFSKVDVVCCRNLLIYLSVELQAKLIPLFNFALNPGGFLFLGKSESIGRHQDLFDTVSKPYRLYRRLTPSRPIALDTPIVPGRKPTPAAGGAPAGTSQAVSYPHAIRLALLNHFAASVVLVDRRGLILQFLGQTSRYLDMPTGDPTLNLLDAAREGLSRKLRPAMGQALADGKAVAIESVRVTRDPTSPVVRITVAPVARRQEDPPLLAVIFEDIRRPPRTVASPLEGSGDETAVRELEDELRMTQQDLQSSIEELQSSNEELRAANEEVISSNEELQSTNEELETSKEEMQSLNEELTTVNAQLHEKAEGLAKASDDIRNFLESTQIATVFLDRDLRIQRFTPATTGLLKLIPSDTGRPLSDLSTHFVDYDFAADVESVVRGGSAIERDVRHADGSSYVVRILPYLGQRDWREGVVVTFTDVTRLRHAEEHTRRLAAVLADSRDAILLLDLEGAIQSWNRGARDMYGWTEEEALRMNFRDLSDAAAVSATSKLIRNAKEGKALDAFETQRRTKSGHMLDVWLTATPVRDEAGQVTGIATTERDMTERRQNLEALAKARTEAEQRAKDLQTLNRELERRVQERTAELRLLANRLAAAQEEERRRIAAGLHDEVCQLLAACQIKLVQAQDGAEPEEQYTILDEANRLLDQASDQVRGLTFELSSAALFQAGFVPAVMELCAHMKQHSGVHFELECGGESDVEVREALRPCLYHCLRELLHNVVKHAGVDHATIKIEEPHGEPGAATTPKAGSAARILRITVRDDGKGFDPLDLERPLTRTGGFGLRHVRERLVNVGGCLRLNSIPGDGTEAVMEVNLDAGDDWNGEHP